MPVEDMFSITGLMQGVYKSGKPEKHGNLRDFVNSGKVRQNSGNLKYTQEILVYQMLFFSLRNLGIEVCA